MRFDAVIDAGALPRVTADRRAPLWWGMLGLVAIETTVVTAFIVSWFYLRMGAGTWPPGGKMPALLLPTLNTVLLLASSGVVLWADHGIRRGDARRLALGLTTAIGMAIVFLVLKAVEYVGKDYRWSDHAYGSIVWTIAGFHSAHVVSLVLKTGVMATLAWRGYFTRERHLGVRVNGIYWHFVVLVWLPLYATLYLAPRVLP